MEISKDFNSHKIKDGLKNNRISTSLFVKAGCFILIIAMLVAFFAPRASAKGYQKNKYAIIEEPITEAPSVEYFIGDQKQDKASMVWSEDGFTGKALSLSGNGEYLYVNRNALRVDAFTVAGHIKWRGAKEGLSKEPIEQKSEPTAENSDPEVKILPSEAETNSIKQRLFTFSWDNGKTSSIIGYPHTKKEGKPALNGFYFNVKRNPLDVDFYEKTNDESSYGLTVNKWHHIALVFTNDTASLYIDGKLHSAQTTNVGFTQFYINKIYIGNGDDGATLNALLDNFAFYNVSLSQEKIQRLAVGIDVNDAETPLPTVDKPLPTAPPVVEPDSEDVVEPVDPPAGLFSTLEPWIIYLAIAILIVFVALSVMLTIYKPPTPKKKPKNKKGSEEAAEKNAEDFNDKQDRNDG